MKVFKKLEIKGENSDLISLLNKIKSKKYKNFNFIVDKSDDYAKMIATSKDCTATFLTSEIENAIAYVWLVVTKNLLYVSNITPNKSGQLTFHQYNSIIDKFYEEIIEKNIIPEFDVNFSKDEITINDLADKTTISKLKSWIDSSNHSTLNTHPLDFKKWCDFIFTSHNNQSTLTASQLEKYLIEDVKIYDEDLVSKIVLEYEYSLDLLKEYDDYR